MKYVNTPSKKLGSAGGAWLKRLIDASIEKDAKLFKGLSMLRNLLNGDHWKNLRGASKDDMKLAVNLAHAHVRTLVPTLYFQDPELDCAPTAPQHAGKEKTWNSIVNNALDKIGFSEEMKKVVLDAVTYPEGVMKDVMLRTEEHTSEANTEGPVPWLSKGSPAHVRIAPNQLIVDYLVKDRNLDNARFIAIRYRKPLHELKLHPIYGKNVKLETEKISAFPTTGNAVGKTQERQVWEGSEIEDTESDTGEELVTIYEVWIHQLVSAGADEGSFKAYQQMCVLLEGQDAPIRELTPWSEVMGEGFNRYPVNRLVLLPVPDEKSQSELGVWQNMQMALNWLMSRMVQLVENDRLLYLYDPSKIKNVQTFKQRFYKGRARELVEKSGDGAVEIVQPSFVGRDNYSLINLVQGYIQQVSGIGQNRRGGSGIRTATEASLVDEGTRLKTDEKVSIVATFLKRVMFNHITITRALVKASGSTKWVFNIGGDAGAVNWLEFSAEDVNWLPEVRIRVNSFRKMDSLAEMQKYASILNMGFGLFKLYGPAVRVDLLFGRMLESAGIYDANRIIGDQDKQMMLQTIELSGIMLGIPTPVLEWHNHPAHVTVIDNFINSEFGQQLTSSSPEIYDRLMQHREEHILMLQKKQQEAAGVSLGENPFAAAGDSGEGNAQSAARDQTSGDRTAVQSVPGGNGEFA